MQPRRRSLRSGFLRSVERFADRPALELAGESLSYAQLLARAAALAATLARAAPQGEPALTAVFGHRSIPAYAAVLAALLRGHGYVPLNPGFPADRTRRMLAHSQCRSMIVDANAATQLDEILDAVPAGMSVLLPDARDLSELRARWP